MTEKRGKSVGLKNLKPFEKGNKAGVGHGRPKGSYSIRRLMAEVLEETPKGKDGKSFDKSYDRMLIARLLKIGLTGKDKDSIAAMREMWDRAEGKATQSIETKGSLDVTGFEPKSLTNEQLKFLVDDLRKGDSNE